MPLTAWRPSSRRFGTLATKPSCEFFSLVACCWDAYPVTQEAFVSQLGFQVSGALVVAHACPLLTPLRVSPNLCLGFWVSVLWFGYSAVGSVRRFEIILIRVELLVQTPIRPSCLLKSGVIILFCASRCKRQLILLPFLVHLFYAVWICQTLVVSDITDVFTIVLGQVCS